MTHQSEKTGEVKEALFPDCPIRNVLARVGDKWSLRVLEEDGFVHREDFAEVPPRVEYSLTARAHSFLPLVNNLLNWAIANMAGIIKDRESKTKSTSTRWRKTFIAKELG